MAAFRHIDLFSGIGGFALAASWVWPEHEVVTFCEIDNYCQRVLRKHWPNTPIHSDIRTFDGTRYAGTVDLLTGGFPCQPFSIAGNGAGELDDRHLWPEMFRVIGECLPRRIVAENVANLIDKHPVVFETVVSDLESLGYDVLPVVIPACAVNAEHRRDRVWILANANSLHAAGAGNGTRSYSLNAKRQDSQEIKARRSRVNNVGTALGLCGDSTYAGIVREYDGIPNRVDRFKGLGNSIDPQVAAEIFHAIKAVDA